MSLERVMCVIVHFISLGLDISEVKCRIQQRLASDNILYVCQSPLGLMSVRYPGVTSVNQDIPF